MNINEIIREMITLLRNEAARYSISIHTDLATDLPSVIADRVQLQQVFMKRMLNGIEAMKDMNPAGALTIKSQQTNNRELLISFSGTGVGVPPEAGGADLECILYDKRARNRDGSPHQPFNHRVPWWPPVGYREFRTVCNFSNSLCPAKSRRTTNQFMTYQDSKTLISGFYIWIMKTSSGSASQSLPQQSIPQLWVSQQHTAIA